MNFFEAQMNTNYNHDYIVINKDSITHFNTYIQDSDGYVCKRTYSIFVYVIGKEEAIKLKTYDKEEFEKWVSQLKGGLNEAKNKK